jgi:hypothetical protein
MELFNCINGGFDSSIVDQSGVDDDLFSRNHSINVKPGTERGHFGDSLFCCDVPEADTAAPRATVDEPSGKGATRSPDGILNILW